MGKRTKVHVFREGETPRDFKLSPTCLKHWKLSFELLNNTWVSVGAFTVNMCDNILFYACKSTDQTSGHTYSLLSARWLQKAASLSGFEWVCMGQHALSPLKGKHTVEIHGISARNNQWSLLCITCFLFCKATEASTMLSYVIQRTCESGLTLKVLNFWKFTSYCSFL